MVQILKYMSPIYHVQNRTRISDKVFIYRTTIYKQRKWLMHKVDQLRTGSKCISVFEFDEQHLISGELDIRIFDDYSEEWAYFILANRDKYNTKPVHHHDIVIGPIADDGVTFQLRRFSTGIIPMEKLIEELKFHKGKTIQYFFGTEKALNYLKKL